MTKLARAATHGIEFTARIAARSPRPTHVVVTVILLKYAIGGSRGQRFECRRTQRRMTQFASFDDDGTDLLRLERDRAALRESGAPVRHSFQAFPGLTIKRKEEAAWRSQFTTLASRLCSAR